MNRGNVEPAVALLETDVDWRGRPNGHLWWKQAPRCHGPDDARENFELQVVNGRARPGTKTFTLEKVDQVGDRLVVGGHWTMEDGPRETADRFFQVMTVCDGRIVDMQGCTSRRAALRLEVDDRRKPVAARYLTPQRGHLHAPQGTPHAQQGHLAGIDGRPANPDNNQRRMISPTTYSRNRPLVGPPCTVVRMAKADLLCDRCSLSAVSTRHASAMRCSADWRSAPSAQVEPGADLRGPHRCGGVRARAGDGGRVCAYTGVVHPE